MDGEKRLSFPDGASLEKYLKGKFSYEALDDGYEITRLKDRERRLRVTVPDGVTSIGNDCFINAVRLKTVSLPRGIVNIGASAFWDCQSLEEFSIPDGIRVIKPHTFGKCASLKRVYIPESVELIALGAFGRCDSLAEIAYAGSSAQWQAVKRDDGNEILNTAKVLYLCNAEVVTKDEGEDDPLSCDLLVDYDFKETENGVIITGLRDKTKRDLRIPREAVSIAPGAFRGEEGIEFVSYCGCKGSWS